MNTLNEIANLISKYNKLIESNQKLITLENSRDCPNVAWLQALVLETVKMKHARNSIECVI